MTKPKKLLSLLLALMMLFSIVPAVSLPVFAESLGPEIVTLSGGHTQRHTVGNYHSAYTGSAYQYGMASYAVPMDGYNGNPDICVPGLSSTDNMVPQGLTYWAAKNWILISAYEPNDAKASCVYALRASDGRLVAQFNLQKTNGSWDYEHVSGMGCSGNNLYIADAGSTIAYIPLSELDVAEGTVKTVRFAGSVNLNAELNNANTSYASFGDGILWTGNFYIADNSSYNTKANASSGTMMLGYNLSGCPDSATEWAALQGLVGNPTYCIPLDAYGINKVQCATVKNGFCYVGTSYGRSNDSQMYIFNVNLGSTIGNITVNGHTKPAILLTNQRTYTHLPMTEGLMVYNGYLWNIFESAAYLYNGKESSVSKNPTDVLWRFDISSLLDIDREDDGAETATGDDQFKAANVSCGDLSFVVPEVIYLTPTTADSSSFQYYANNTAAGAAVAGYETTGKVYYNYAGASTATLSYKFYNENLSKELSGGSVTLSSSTISSGNTGVSITGGSSPSVSGGGSSYIQWALTYTDSNDGKTKKAYAYTYVYDNNISSHNNVVADQVFQLVTASKQKNREILNWAIWISGVSGIQSYAGDRADKYANCRYAYPPLTTSSINLKSGSSTDPSNSDTIDGCYFEANGNMGYTGYWWKDGGTSSGRERTQVSFYKAYINFDSSRITNTSQIPNLKVGLDIFENWGGDGDGTNSWGLGYYASDSSENQTNLISQTSSSGNNSNRPSGRISGNIKTLSINVSSLTSAKTYVLQSRGTSRNNGYEVDTKAKLYFDLIPINKASLRTAVQNATKAMAKLGVNGAAHGKLTSLYFNSDNDYRWVAFQNAYKNAMMALTRLDGSNDQALIDALNNALANLSTEVTFVNSNTGRGTIATVSGKTNPTYVKIGTAQSVSINPATYVTATAKTGYSFEGWSTSSTATSGSTGNISVGYNNTLYAIWKPINYTISYNLNQGSVSGNPTSYTIETSPVVLKNPTKTGYTFAGWTGTNGNTPQMEVVVPNGVGTGLSTYTTSNPYEANNRDNIFGNTFTVQPGTTYRVLVTAKRQSGTLNMQGGIWYTSQTSGSSWDGYGGEFTYWRDAGNGWAVYYKDITVPTGKQAGQFYVQIDQNHGGDGHVWLLADCAVIKFSLENISYTANWTPNTYTVAYNGNGSTGGSTASSSHTYDTAKNLTANGFSRAFTITYNANGGTCGTPSATATATATFNGWATSASGAKVYDNNQSVTNLTATNGVTVTLYAKWTDGTVELSSASKAYDANYHYSFDGWYDAATGGSKIGNAGASYTPSANKTLYAHYKATAHSYTDSVTSQATCTDTGVTEHTCTCGRTYNTNEPAALGHSYNYQGATFNWSGFTCATATVKCSRNNSHTETENTSVTSAVTADPGYDTAGERTYTAKFTKNGADYTDSKTDSIPSLYSLVDLSDAPAVTQGFTAGGVYTLRDTTKKSGIGCSVVGLAENVTAPHPVAKTSGAISGYGTTTLELSNAWVTVMEDGSRIKVTPITMTFNEPITFYAVVAVTGTQAEKYETNTVYSYEKITIKPTQILYYEETEGGMTYTSAIDANGYGEWGSVGTASTAEKALVSAEDAGIGFSSAYSSFATYSGGTAKKVSVSTDVDGEWPKVSFSFTGTGFDLISVTDCNSGVFVVTVSQNGTQVKRRMADTYYGSAYTPLFYNLHTGRILGDNHEGADYVVPLYFADTSRTIPQDVIVYDGMASEIVYTTDVNYAKSPEQAYGWVLTGAGDALYQIPVISMTDLTYGTYDVTVEARFTDNFRHYKTDNNGNKYYDLTVDGVRVYEPAKTNASAYADGGNLVTFTNIRENAGNTSSMILVDGKNDLSAAQFNNYLMIAPKNEIYLKSGGTAVFEINASGCTDLRLGMKSANGGSCNVSIAYSGSNKTSSVTIDTATEMYYSVSGLVGTGSGTLTVTNNGSGILSLTKLMAVTPPQTASAAPRRLLTVNENTLANAHMLLDMQTADIAIHEESVQAQTGSDGTVTLTLTTGADAETVVVRDAEGNVIDPDSVEFTLTDSGEKNWTVTFTEAREGTFTYTLQAEYENGYTGSAEPTEATVTVSFNTDPTGEDSTGTDPTGEELLGGLSDILAKLRSIFDILREFIRTIAALFR